MAGWFWRHRRSAIGCAVTDFHIITLATGYFFAGILVLQAMRRSGMVLKQDGALAYLVPVILWPLVLIIALGCGLGLLCQRLVEGARE